jgi:hypothetical protein
MNPHDDKADYPILRGDLFSTDNMDGFIREIIQVLERCSMPQLTFSDEERADNEYLIYRVLEVDMAIALLKGEGYEAYRLLLHKRLATPDNLDALLRMVDTDMQTGNIRCIAFKILYRLVQVNSTWSLKMKDGSYFATAYVATCCKTLENESNDDIKNRHTERFCDCFDIAPLYLTTAIHVTKDAPVTVIERVHAFNWAQILSKTQAKANEFETDPNQWFIGLHSLCMNALRKNADHSLAREFLQKLEMCHDFFRGVLEHLVTLTRSLPSAPREEIGNLLNPLSLIQIVLQICSFSLTPPPHDPKMDVLVRLAHQTLKEGRPSVAALQDPTVDQDGFALEDYDELLSHTNAQQWAGLKTLSDLQRRQKFEDALNRHASDHKAARRGVRKDLKNAIGKSNGKDELCANCYMLESKMDEGEKLSKCGWCKQVTYCSRECQKLHWKKAHKKECARKKK